VYSKPNATTPRGRRRKRPGARDGHPGHHRPTPTRIDEHREHRLKVCPCCGGSLQRCRRSRTRLIEDLPENLQSVVTEHTIHRDYCPQCKKHVEPVVPDALPNATFGHRLVSFASWCHYGLGVTLDQLIDILQFHLRTKLSAGGLSATWQRLADILTPWYEQLAEEAKKSAYLHADETGWRVQGQTCWLWCFANGQVCYYLIDRCRGSSVLQRFFGEAFDGILLHDFWAAYESIAVLDRQYCLVSRRAGTARVGEGRPARYLGPVAGVRQDAAAAGPGRHPPAQAPRLHAAEVPQSYSAPGPAAGRLDRDRVRRCGRPPAAQTSAADRRPSVHVPGLSADSV
jgi:transposase